MSSATIVLITLAAVMSVGSLIIVWLRPRGRDKPRSENRTAWSGDSALPADSSSAQDVSCHSPPSDGSSHGGSYSGFDGGGHAGHGGSDGGGHGGSSH
jgi:uncharacterized membrane protein YgcG